MTPFHMNIVIQNRCISWTDDGSSVQELLEKEDTFYYHYSSVEIACRKAIEQIEAALLRWKEKSK